MALIFWVWTSAVIAAMVKGQLARPETNMLPELLTARIFCGDVELRTASPIPMHGRVEQAYLIHGYAVVMQTKVRPQTTVNKSDRIELSAQAMLLQAVTGQPSADYGVLRLRTESGRDVYRRVFLLSGDELVAMYRRRIEIRSGRSPAGGPYSTTRCAQCARRRTCDRGIRTAAV
jgi:hypothetical protein